MENEISISKHFQEIFSTNHDLRDKLQEIADWLQHTFSFKCYFCEIIGRRWSFCSGTKETILLQKRIQISEKMGWIIEDTDIDNNLLETLISILKEHMDEKK